MDNSTIKEHIVEDGIYIPIDFSNFPSVPDQPLVKPVIIHNFDFENNYPFYDKSFKGRLLNLALYTGIFFIAFPANKIRYGLKIKGKENLRKNKKLLKDGAMTVSNHIYRWDFISILSAVKYRRMWFPARALQVQSKDSNFVRGAGGIPIPETISGIKGFYKAFDQLHKEKRWIHVFPESCRWDFYEPIRPFTKTTFKMAMKYDLPVIPMAFSYRKPTGIYKLFGCKHPLITLTIGEPIFIDKESGLSKNEVCNNILLEAHHQITKMAGIKQNMWPENLD